MEDTSKTSRRPISASKTGISNATPSARWQCLACDLMQTPKPACRRCLKPFRDWREYFASRQGVKVEVVAPRRKSGCPPQIKPDPAMLSSIRTLAELETEAIINALEVCCSVELAAKALGSSKTKIHAWIKEGKIPRPVWLREVEK